MSVTNTLPGPDSHFITLSVAETMTGTYRTNREAILGTNYQNQDILPLSETFNRNAFDALLAQTGCEGIRIYYGMDTNLDVHAVLVAVNEDNEDILSTGQLLGDPIIIEIGQRCPDLCPPASDLNE